MASQMRYWKGYWGNHNVHDLQFGDIGLDDISQDSQGPDPIHGFLERQATALEKLAIGISDIAQALREIAVALAPKNLQRVMPIQRIESPIE